MPKKKEKHKQKTIFGYLSKPGRGRRANAQAPAAVPPPAAAAGAGAPQPPQPNVDDGSIAVAAPDAVPSAAAAGKQSDDDPMEIKEEEEPAAVNQVDLVVSAGADRKLSGGPKNEDDEGDEAEAGDYEATSHRLEIKLRAAKRRRIGRHKEAFLELDSSDSSEDEDDTKLPPAKRPRLGDKRPRSSSASKTASNTPRECGGTRSAAASYAASSSSAPWDGETDDEYGDDHHLSARKNRRLQFDGRGDVDDRKPSPDVDDRKPSPKRDGSPKSRRPHKRRSDHAKVSRRKYDEDTVRKYSTKLRRRHAKARGEAPRRSTGFSSMIQRDVNAMQRAALANTRTICSRGIDILHANDEVVNVASKCWHLVNRQSKVLSIDKPSPFVYMKGQPEVVDGVEESEDSEEIEVVEVNGDDVGDAEVDDDDDDGGGVREPIDDDGEESEVDDDDSEDGGLKVGHTTDGSIRVDHYVKEFREKVKHEIDFLVEANVSADDLRLSLLIDVNRLLTKSQAELVKFLLDRLKSLTFDEFPTTIGEALNHDMQGPPINAQIWIFSLLKDVDECKMVGGGIDVNGILSRFVMNALETGMTEWLRQRGVKIDGLRCLDELFHNDCFGAFLDLDDHTCKDLGNFFVEFQKRYPQHAANLSELSIEVDKAMTSWPLNLPDPAPEFVPCKIATTNAIFGDGNWEDAFDEPPPGTKPTGDDDDEDDDEEVGPYNPNYSEDAKREAKRRTIDKVQYVEKYGGCGAIDKNGVAWGDTPTDQFKLVKYLTGGEHLTLLGPEFAWSVFWNYKGIYVLILDYDKD
ncbi:hypothetical protein THAOC_00479, partial [Thalassiosira oceanica]